MYTEREAEYRAALADALTVYERNGSLGAFPIDKVDATKISSSRGSKARAQKPSATKS